VSRNTDNVEEKKPKRKILAVLLVFLLIIVASAAVYNLVVTWSVTADLSISLISPSNNEETNESINTFSWESDGGFTPHRYVFYIDTSSRFNSRNLITESLNTNATSRNLTDGLWHWRVEVTDNITASFLL